MAKRGRFIATEDFDLAGNHFHNWLFLGDIPAGGALTDKVLVFDGSSWQPKSITGTSGIIEHGSLIGLGDNDHPQYEMAGHTHAEYELVNHTHAEYELVNHTHAEYELMGHTHAEYAPVTASAGPLSAGTNIVLTTSIGAVTISVTDSPTFAGAKLSARGRPPGSSPQARTTCG